MFLTPSTKWIVVFRTLACKQAVGTMYHIFWHCPSLDPFWEDATATIKHSTSVDLSGNPAACLLHLTERPTPKYKQSLTIHLVNAARVCIHMLWRQTQPPTSVLWYAKINDILHMEELNTTLNMTEENFRERWMPLWYFTCTDGLLQALSQTEPIAGRAT